MVRREGCGSSLPVRVYGITRVFFFSPTAAEPICFPFKYTPTLPAFQQLPNTNVAVPIRVSVNVSVTVDVMVGVRGLGLGMLYLTRPGRRTPRPRCGSAPNRTNCLLCRIG